MARNIPTTVNAAGLEEIRAFLAARLSNGGGNLSDEQLAAWARQAEFQMGEGNPPSIEIKGYQAASGRTEEFTISAAGVDSVAWMDWYQVKADRETGEWRGEPEYMDAVQVSEWNANKDTDDVHYDTYEHDGETRAIEVVWVE